MKPERAMRETSSAHAPERSIALWRLQAAWPTLTDLQQRSLVTLMSGQGFGRGNGAEAPA